MHRSPQPPLPPVFLLFFVVAMLLPYPPVHAAVLELTAIDERDNRITDTPLSLRKLDSTRRNPFPTDWATTDSQGLAVFTDIDPGRYEVQLGVHATGFVELRGHPSIAPPTITVGADQAPLQTVVRFLRGTPVVFRVAAEGSSIQWSRIQLHDLDRDYRAEIKMDELAEREVRLPAGRWTARVVPVPGYLLMSVEVNRNPFPNDIAEFDLPIAPNPWYVSFDFTAPARIWGTVTFEGDPFDVHIVAKLLEAGPWLPAVQARGGSKFESVWARPRYPRWDYEMVVPDGTWSIRAVGDTLESADPEQLELHLAPGDERHLDFTVSGTAEDGLNMTVVDVREPNGTRARGAVVEVWPSDPEALANAEAPIARAVAEWGQAYLRGVNGRELLFVAGMPGFVEVMETTEVPEPDSGFGHLSLTLRSGGTIHAVAVDDQKQPIPGIAARLSLLDGDGSIMQSREIARWAVEPTGRTDGTGHLWLRGIYPGSYLLSGERKPESGGMFFAEFRHAGEEEWYRELEMDFPGAAADEGAIDELEIRLAEAGSIQSSFQCSDGSALPEEADLHVLLTNREYSRMDPKNWSQQAVLSRRDYVLTGKRRDSARLGPLDFDSYHVLTRPQGHNRWTWAIGGELPEDAALIEVAPGKPTDLGTIEIDCAPAISVQPVPADGGELPDLSRIDAYKPTADCAGTQTVGGEEIPIDDPRLQVLASRIEFRDLPEAEVDLTVRLWNPFFLPEPELNVSVEATLQRGNTLRLKPAVDGIGGAIAVTLREGNAGRYVAIAVHAQSAVSESTDRPETSTGFTPTIHELNGDAVLVPSLPAGRYEIAACLDSDCVEQFPLWKPVDVEPGEIATALPR